jgi:hypothetical protein
VKKIANAEEAQLQVELEKGSGRTAEDCTHCFKFIISGIDRFVRRLQKNAFLVPLHVRVAFRALFDGIVAKFPAVDALQSCTSLFFLRVLCPALLNPSLYGVYANSLPPTALRTLLLISRILQSSANGQVPSSPFSNIINLNVIATVTIERYTPSLRAFMQSVCDPQAITELTKMQISPSSKQIKTLKRVLRDTRATLEAAQQPPPAPPPPPPSTASRISSTLGKLTKGRTVSQPIPPLSQSSPSKPKKPKSKSAKSSDSVSKGGKRARALTSHDVFGGVDDAASSTSTPPASPRPAAPPPGSTLFATTTNPDGQSPSKRRMKLNLDSVELSTVSHSHRASSDGISWLVSPRNSTSSRPTTAEAKRKRLVNRMSTMLPKKSVLDEFDSMKQPT